jgi:hypothetical protein
MIFLVIYNKIRSSSINRFFYSAVSPGRGARGWRWTVVCFYRVRGGEVRWHRAGGWLEAVGIQNWWLRRVKRGRGVDGASKWWREWRRHVAAHLLVVNWRGVTDDAALGDLRREKTPSGPTWAERPGTWVGVGKIPGKRKWTIDAVWAKKRLGLQKESSNLNKVLGSKIKGFKYLQTKFELDSI